MLFVAFFRGSWKLPEYMNRWCIVIVRSVTWLIEASFPRGNSLLVKYMGTSTRIAIYGNAIAISCIK